LKYLLRQAWKERWHIEHDPVLFPFFEGIVSERDLVEMLPSSLGVKKAFDECSAMGLNQDYWEAQDHGPSLP